MCKMIIFIIDIFFLTNLTVINQIKRNYKYVQVTRQNLNHKTSIKRPSDVRNWGVDVQENVELI